MNSGDNLEKRSSVRIKVELRIYYGPHQSKLLTGYSVDLGAGGIFLSTTCPFDIDDIVKLKFSLPQNEEKIIACDARVAWINKETNRVKPEYPVGAGLQFVNLPPEDIAFIVSQLEIEATW